MPSGIPYIVGNEFAERFSYYGMRSVLVVFMTSCLLGANGLPDNMSEPKAKEWFHLFISAVYFTPLLGSLIADCFLGKYRTIIVLSIVYCLGHLALSLDATRMGLLLGLSLIACGAGGIKPCVSAHVGDQFGATNQHLIPRVFSSFYFSINSGSVISTLLIPWLLKNYGAHVAFAVPGIFMFLATVVFWMGRNKFVHIPANRTAFLGELLTRESLKIILRVAVLYIFVAAFWALFDQTASAWVLQANHMNLHWLGHDWLPAQLQAMNPFLVVILIPIFSYGIYPLIEKVFPLTPLRKIGIGFFVAVPSFLIPAWIETQIAHGAKPSIGWHFIAYTFITAAEVLISITCLEFSYTQAPKKLKSFIMGIFLASVTVGDLFIAGVNLFIENKDGTSKLPGADYYNFFAILMFITAIIYVFYARKLKVHTYIQDEQPA